MKKCHKTMAVLVCAAFALCFTQCTKSPEDLIVGSWIVEYTETTSTYDDETEIEHETPEEGEQVVITFNKDLTVVIEETEIEDGATHITTSRGTYLITDNKLTLKSDDENNGVQTFNIDLLDKKELTLSANNSGSYADHTYSITLKIQMKRK